MQGFLLLKDRIGLFFLYILLLRHLVLARLTFLVYTRAILSHAFTEPGKKIKITSRKEK